MSAPPPPVLGPRWTCQGCGQRVRSQLGQTTPPKPWLLLVSLAYCGECKPEPSP